LLQGTQARLVACETVHRQCSGIAIDYLLVTRGDDYARFEVLNCRVPPGFASPQRLLGALAFGDVAGDAEPFDNCAVCILDRNSPGECPPPTTVHLPHPMFEFEYAAIPDGFVKNC